MRRLRCRPKSRSRLLLDLMHHLAKEVNAVVAISIISAFLSKITLFNFMSLSIGLFIAPQKDACQLARPVFLARLRHLPAATDEHFVHFKNLPYSDRNSAFCGHVPKE